MEVIYIYRQSNQNLSDEKQQQNPGKHFLESKLNDEIEKKSFKESMEIDYSLNHGNIDFEQNIYEVHSEIKKAKNQLSSLLKNQKAKTEEIIKSIGQNYDNLNNYKNDISAKEKDIQERYDKLLNIVSERQKGTGFSSVHNFSAINEPIYHSKQESFRNANSNLILSLVPEKKRRTIQLKDEDEKPAPIARRGLSRSKSSATIKNNRFTGLESLPPSKY